MVVPIRYRKTPPITLNFDFADIAANVGYITFFGFTDEAGSTVLGRQTLVSTTPRTIIQTATPGVTSELNFDFDFGIAQKVKGELYVTITIFADDSSTGGVTNDTTVEIFHVDGASSETSIGTQQSIAQLLDGDGTRDHFRTTLTFDVDKQFAKGDKLRVEIIMTINGNNNGSDLIGVYHDGINRNFSITDQFNIATDSNLIVNVPFELNL